MFFLSRLSQNVPQLFGTRLINKGFTEIRTILEEAEEVDKREDRVYGDKNPYTGEGKVSVLVKKIETLKEAKERAQKEEKEKVNTTDPEANIMQFSDKTKKPAYNGQVAVDGKAQVIVACRLTD
ncbi:MAG: hypothetical protein WBA22_10135, partial [Candidatus Methanofastidiosia archaeon]